MDQQIDFQPLDFQPEAPPPPKPTERQPPTDAEWAAMPAGEKIRNVLEWAGNAIGGSFLQQPGMGTQAKEHPGEAALLLGSAALPGVLSVAGEYGGPAIRAAAQTTGRVLSHPATGAAIGAYQGRNGGVEGVLTGAALGAAGSSATGRFLKRLGLDASPSAQMVKGMSQAGATKTPMELLDEAIARGLAKGGMSRPSAPAPSQTSLKKELLARIENVDWRTTDAVPINALKTPGIIEPGESRVGLAERAATAAKQNPSEVDALLKALRQRMHISEKAR